MSANRELPGIRSHTGLSLADGAPPDGLDLLGQMWRIRLFEEAVQDLFTKSLVRGSTHLCQGQEAVSVGVCSALRTTDTLTCTYRGHGHSLAKGASLAGCFGELLGRAGGVCRGMGGSMHLTDLTVGLLGSNAIVGAHLPISVGAGLTAAYRGTEEVAVTLFGDGATNIGAFHEAVNLAAVWQLPVLFVIENNQYGEYSPLRSTTPIDRLVTRAASYGIPGVHVDGNDVVAVREVTREAVALARSGGGPTLIEADTYRQVGHSRADPATYRPAGELDRWLARDPILVLTRVLVEAHGEPTVDAVVAEARSDVDAALEEALAMPLPPAEQRWEGVFA